MIQALFQHFPRGLFEAVAVLGAAGAIGILVRHWKKDRAETLCWGAALLFVIGWRLLLPIRSDRYVLFLIPAMIFFAVMLLDGVAKKWRRISVNFLLGLLLAASLFKAFHRPSGDEQIFEMIRLMKKDAGNGSGVRTVVSDRDLAPFLDGKWNCSVMRAPETFAFLPKADYYLFKLNREKLPASGTPAQLVLIREEIRGKQARFALWKRVDAK